MNIIPNLSTLEGQREHYRGVLERLGMRSPPPRVVRPAPALANVEPPAPLPVPGTRPVDQYPAVNQFPAPPTARPRENHSRPLTARQKAGKRDPQSWNLLTFEQLAKEPGCEPRERWVPPPYAPEGASPEEKAKAALARSTRAYAMRIVKAVAKAVGGEPDDILGDCRHHRLVIARQYAMWRVRRELGVPLQQIGHWFGGRDHTTALHAYTKVEKVLGQ